MSSLVIWCPEVISSLSVALLVPGVWWLFGQHISCVGVKGYGASLSLGKEQAKNNLAMVGSLGRCLVVSLL